MTIARNGFSAHAPKLLVITGVIGSDDGTRIHQCVAVEAQRQGGGVEEHHTSHHAEGKKIARGTIRFGS